VLDAGERYWTRKSAGQRVPLDLKDSTFWLEVGVSALGDVPGLPAETLQDGERDAVDPPIVLDEEVRRGATGLHAAIGAGDAQARLRALRYSIRGDKAMLWKHLLKAEQEERKAQKANEAAEQEAQRRREGRGEVLPDALVVPEATDQATQEKYNLMRVRYKAWCPICVAAKGRSTPHIERPRKTQQVVQLDWCYLKASGEDAERGEQTFAGSLVTVHVNKGRSAATSVLKEGADGQMCTPRDSLAKLYLTS